MGDVEGHDMGAAALMGMIRSAVRAYALKGHPPAFVMERFNRFLAGLNRERICRSTVSSPCSPMGSWRSAAPTLPTGSSGSAPRCRSTPGPNPKSLPTCSSRRATEPGMNDVALMTGRLTADSDAGQRFIRRLPATPGSVFLARRFATQLCE